MKGWWCVGDDDDDDDDGVKGEDEVCTVVIWEYGRVKFYMFISIFHFKHSKCYILSIISR